jgi:DNA-directed RNA polymerase specialized sigma24 family protein
LNAADDQRRKERRDHGGADIDDVLDVADDAPTPEAVTLAKSELAAVEAVLAGFSPRRRAIFLAARLHDIPRQVIADRLGVSRRLVAKELLAAHTAFLARFREFKN